MYVGEGNLREGPKSCAHSYVWFRVKLVDHYVSHIFRNGLRTRMFFVLDGMLLPSYRNCGK